MWARFLDVIYPAQCELCQTSLQNGRSLCDPCRDGLPRIQDPFCNTCSEGFQGNITESFQCPNCSELKFHFEFARAALISSDDARYLIHDFKYKRHFYLADELAEFLMECFTEDPRLADLEDPILIPVPLHWWRRQQRTENQAYEIALSLSKMTGYPICEALKRQRATLTQTKLPRKERLKNLKKAFVLKPSMRKHIAGRTVLLIDDVFTTGSTAHECARILKHDGDVERVICLTVLRG